MTSLEHQRRRYALLRELLDADPPAREALLAARCAGDEPLAAEMRRLLDDAGDDVFDRDAASLYVELGEGEDEDEDEDDEIIAGTVIAGWRIGRLLGTGGMGRVYFAERHGDGYVQHGALKLIKRGMDSHELVARFRRERGILSRLNHPNIARLLDGGIAADGRPFLVMEYIEGETLDAWSTRGDATSDARIDLFLSICAAVAHAHHRLVVHRDIKPGNVMLAGDGQPRLLDFGIAKVLADDDGELTRTVHAPLSRAYAAPEQLDNGLVSTATDIYQLGLLLRHLLATTRITGDLGVILARATDTEPARRYATVESLAEDVRRWREGRPILARVDSVGYRLRRFASRHRLAFALAALAVFALLGGTALAIWQAQRAEREASLARASQAFLTSVFDAAAPDAQAGARVTARDLLDRGSERIDRDLADSPRLRADLLGTFGTLYRQLGQYERADAMLARALEALPDMAAGDRQRLSVERAGIARENDRLDEADAQLTGILADPATLLLRARALVERAQINEQRGRFEEALADAKAAAELEGARGAIGRVDHAFARQIEALALSRLGRFDEAELAFTAAIEEAERVLGADDTRVARIRNDYAGMLGGRSRAVDCEAQARLALTARRKRLGDRHAAVAETLQILGGCMRLQGRLDEASVALGDALAIQRETFGEQHAQVANTLNSLGILEAARGNMAVAATHLGEALDTVRLIARGENTNSATIATNLATILMRLGRYAEAQPLLDAARERYRITFGERHPAIVSNENSLAQLALRRDRFDDALTHARTAATMADAVMSPGRENAAIHLTLANVLLRTGHPDEALAECDVARRVLAQVDAGNDPRSAQADRITADALIALGRLDEARPRVEAVSAVTSSGEPALRIAAMALRARFALASGHPDEARRERAAARDVLAAIEQPDPELAREIARD